MLNRAAALVHVPTAGELAAQTAAEREQEQADRDYREMATLRRHTTPTTGGPAFTRSRRARTPGKGVVLDGSGGRAGFFEENCPRSAPNLDCF
jgi:hypothetical protein